MRKDEIVIDQEYAAAGGSGKFDRATHRLVRVRIIALDVEHEVEVWTGFRTRTETQKGVEVKVLDAKKDRPPYFLSDLRKGENTVISTRQIIQPWSEVEESRKLAEQWDREQKAEDRDRKARVKALRPWLEGLGLIGPDHPDRFEDDAPLYDVKDYSPFDITVRLEGLEKMKEAMN